ncbi:hypothetical protein H1P_2830004 [Hyella patelloides LEGE 07179]|uniref:Transposase n=1 Tax=Hyella patelloides LEGE 07179 TaxID=945734 RepID=A0A563VTE0_9CYAN|nr:hypothetical protein H1P_2830004 [Hyella patelloides LEGE 07179]
MFHVFRSLRYVTLYVDEYLEKEKRRHHVQYWGIRSNRPSF